MNKPPENGACIGYPTDWWYPIASNRDTPGTRQVAREATSKALEICSKCHVRTDCLQYSLEWEPHGIWGGMTERERSRMRRRLGLNILRPSVLEVAGYANRV